MAAINSLTDAFVRSVEPPKSGAPAKYTDGLGMYLAVAPSGARSFRMDYRYAGKRKTMSFGAYPEVGLADARRRRDAARRVLDGGADPMAER